MALVNYSDSDSDPEIPPTPPNPQYTEPLSSKIVGRSATGKIKVDLPSLKTEPDQHNGGEPPAKRKRAGGTFSGFNSLLPPPTGRARSALKPGISLKTSGEATFSRLPAETGSTLQTSTEKPADAPVSSAQIKFVGKATQFVPLSVANRKKKQQTKNLIVDHGDRGAKTSTIGGTAFKEVEVIEQTKKEPKRSLFMVSREEDTSSKPELKPEKYEPLLERSEVANSSDDLHASIEESTPATVVQSNSLESVVSDLNLTAAQRRQLFGRKSKNFDMAHFNMDAEYAANEEIRKAGETVQHRAVKAIAPGKHSLQQLVSNAKSQKDAMEDAWAEGRRNRGEGGSKYGWG